MSREGIGKVAVITGVGRRRSIGTGIARPLARDGWHLALNYWRPYDDRLGYQRNADDPESIADSCRAFGVHVELVPGDLGDPVVPAELVRTATQARGPVSALVMSDCESVDSSILSTDLASWDRHFAVNSRATWLLIKARLLLQSLTTPARVAEWLRPAGVGSHSATAASASPSSMLARSPEPSPAVSGPGVASTAAAGAARVSVIRVASAFLRSVLSTIEFTVIP